MVTWCVSVSLDLIINIMKQTLILLYYINLYVVIYLNYYGYSAIFI